jgi:hypothetical protein
MKSVAGNKSEEGILEKIVKYCKVDLKDEVSSQQTKFVCDLEM